MLSAKSLPQNGSAPTQTAIPAPWCSLADAMLVEAEAASINLDQLFLRVPVLAFAAHALANDARVQPSAARVADAIQNAVGLGWKFLAQTLFEIRRQADDLSPPSRSG
jgi:hypothetical protein